MTGFVPFQYALDHPIASPVLTHFTGRRGQTPAEHGQAPTRLQQLLWSQQILGSAPYSAGPPAVSFTESRIEDLGTVSVRSPNRSSRSPNGLGVNVVYDGSGTPTFADSIRSLAVHGVMAYYGTVSTPLRPWN
jgi:hypothetical protein